MVGKSQSLMLKRNQTAAGGVVPALHGARLGDPQYQGSQADYLLRQGLAGNYICCPVTTGERVARANLPISPTCCRREGVFVLPTSTE